MSNRLEHGNVIKRYITTHYYITITREVSFMNETKICRISKCDFILLSKYPFEYALLLEITIILFSNYVTVFTVIRE